MPKCLGSSTLSDRRQRRPDGVSAELADGNLTTVTETQCAVMQNSEEQRHPDCL